MMTMLTRIVAISWDIFVKDGGEVLRSRQIQWSAAKGLMVSKQLLASRLRTGDYPPSTSLSSLICGCIQGRCVRSTRHAHAKKTVAGTARKANTNTLWRA